MAQRRTQPNQRLEATAHRLQSLAYQTTATLEHIVGQLAHLDGYSSGGGDGGGRSADQSSTVERAMLARHGLLDVREQIRDDIDAIVSIADHLAATLARGLGQRAPAAAGHKRCRDNQYGREGTIKWGKPTCEELPMREGGLCSACTRAEGRYRALHGLPDRRTTEAAA